MPPPRGDIATSPWGVAGSAHTSRGAAFKAVSARGRLGAGLVTVPRVPKGDPLAAILADPQVPENQRFCGNPLCGQPVGRAGGGTGWLDEGECGSCGTPYSFAPKLSAGDVVGGQYQVQGCIAHGGLGWIYLAIDRQLHNRWVVLKGVLNSGDPDAMAAAEAEVLTLTNVEHPNIVGIHNFVEHRDAAGVPVGYIVMEFVDGITLKQIRGAHNGPLPPDQAVAYIIEIAPALAYLHSQGLAYCDFKPDNVMQSDERLKLIDLGAVMSMDDEESSIFGTRGYQAPEIAETGPTIASDVYTVGRTLAALVIDIPKKNGRLLDELPGPDTAPILARHESLHRCILRATDPNPDRRFASIDELADQLTGVLHEIVAVEHGTPPRRMSSRFSPQRAVFGTGRETPVDPAHVVAALPIPVVDPADPGAGLLATTSGTPPALLETAIDLAGGAVDGRPSTEVPLRLVRASLELGDPAAARERLAHVEPHLHGDWRLPWYRAQCALLDGDLGRADADFTAVLAALPGELAPKLAIAATAELRGRHDRAARYYDLVWQTDHSYVSAAFGLARQRARVADRDGAITALDQVPASSAHFTAARAMAIEVILDQRAPEMLDESALLEARSRTAALTLESPARRAALRLRVLGAALDWLQAGQRSDERRFLDSGFDEAGIRAGMERAYRDLARDATDVWERIALVERANAVRPRTRL